MSGVAAEESESDMVVVVVEQGIYRVGSVNYIRSSLFSNYHLDERTPG